MRELKEDERFATDDEFERQVREGEFRKNDELVRSIRGRYKNTNLDGIARDRPRDARSTRMPRDMSKLFKMTGDKIE